MTLHPSTFSYLNPTDEQKEKMNTLREAAGLYAMALMRDLPEGPDKTYVLRKLREVAMWANVAITRLPDGTPRREATPEAGFGDSPLRSDKRPDYPADHPAPGDLGSVPL